MKNPIIDVPNTNGFDIEDKKQQIAFLTSTSEPRWKIF